MRFTNTMTTQGYPAPEAVPVTPNRLIGLALDQFRQDSDPAARWCLQYPKVWSLDITVKRAAGGPEDDTWEVLDPSTPILGGDPRVAVVLTTAQHGTRHKRLWYNFCLDALPNVAPQPSVTIFTAGEGS